LAPRDKPRLDQLVPVDPEDHPADRLPRVAGDRARHARYGLGSSLATIIPASAAPYGYTLAVWSCGAALLRSHGTPTLGDTLMFVAGAILGFTLLGVLAIGLISHARPIERRTDRVLAGVLDWIALGAVIGAVYLISSIHGWAPWLLGPLTATIIYLLIASLQLAVLASHQTPSSGKRPT
jgi:peptidoglycan/LPS O-acetylase OafA/YrhL